ncbi:MAG: helicase-exonuclease AddAB subunit AddA [Clostridia bacterium]|nr:helicase-exonuclease AddAB subunit AddA [Clostridia bacterium]
MEMIKKEPIWTDQQQQVINARNCNLLVSASAGSGKTTVMIERIKHLIENDEADISEILAVTFTNVAAEEMRIKLQENLEEVATTNVKIKSQIENIELADISTLHSFCQKLIRTNFYEIGIDPSFSVIDESESEYLKNQALNKVFNIYSKKEDLIFNEIAESFNTKRNDKKFREIILQIYNFINSQSSAENWLKNIAIVGYEPNLEKNINAKLIVREIVKTLSVAEKELTMLITETINKGYERLNVPLVSELGLIKQILIQNTYENLFNFLKEKVRFPSISSEKFEAGSIGDNLKEKVRATSEKFKKTYSKCCENICLNCINFAEIKENLVHAYSFEKKLAEIVLSFKEIYSKLKSADSVLDFNDLEHFALVILKNPNIVQSLHKKYKYIFIDEYQDINDVQEEIINLLANENNLFMVGDVKQSIYGFRQCDPEIFAQKYVEYKTFSSVNKKIDLNHNFRSNKYILWFVNSIFRKIMTYETASVNYAQNALFISGANYKNTDYPVVSLKLIDKKPKENSQANINSIYDLTAHEEVSENIDLAILEGNIIASEIVKLKSSNIYVIDKRGNGTCRQTKYSDMVILMRSAGAYMQKICEELSRYNIPVSADYKENIFDSMEVKFLNSLLYLINNYKQDVPLASVMRSLIFNFTDDEMATIRREFDLINIDSAKSHYYDACEWYVKNKNDNLSQKLKAFYATIDNYRNRLKYQTIYELLKNIVSETSFINLCCALPAGEERTININLFINSFIGKKYNRDLPKYIEYSENYDIKINSALGENLNTVRVLTMHKSKGLEFPIVFVCGMGKGFNYESLKAPIVLHKKYGLGLKNFDIQNRFTSVTLARKACEIALKQDMIKEEMRILYVALTRAKNHLIIVGSLDLNKSKKSDANIKCYLDWILKGLTDAQKRQILLSKNEKYNFSEIDGSKIEDGYITAETFSDEIIIQHSLSSEKNVIFNAPDFTYLNEIKRTFDYEYSSLVSTKTPLKNTVTALSSEHDSDVYYTGHVSFAEDNKSISALKGTTYHKIMQYADLENTNETIDNFVQRKIITKEDSNFIDINEINKCKQNIIKLIKSADKIYKEQPFLMYVPHNQIDQTSTLSDRILIQGVVDLIIIKDNSAIIVDYKTTRANSFEDLAKIYFTQLNIYAQATSEALNISVKSAYIYSFVFNKLIKVF